ncbi:MULTISPECIES: hypothetical protein [unclassified Xanthomonas]|uniref:hypothetical protein n=1 Tax=unclassified Xanthomonas TaxID=2643310 RepID=UPI002882EE77|nr:MULTISPECIES: hypothetical protein [unclassified Xanthomonas]
MASELSIELREYLKRCGLPERVIAQCNGGTRMYHDLGLHGDIAEAYMEVLAEHYYVDLGGFEFEKFFPPEFSGRSIFTRTLLWIVPFAGKAARQGGEYLPLTLGTIERVMRAKQWSAGDIHI